MNAQTTITAESAYETAIAAFCPDGDEMTMAVRIEIATIRDQATLGLRRATDSAAVMLSEVSRLAQSAVYAQRPTSDLMRILSALKLTMMAARSIDRVTRDG